MTDTQTTSPPRGIAIRARGVSKNYHIYTAAQDRLKQAVLPRLRRMVRMREVLYYRDFWALQDVSFEVPFGRTVGIIGRNGSGKSTLLQIVCGTLAPTNGTVELNGRVAALLELGSGFNPEFTGRENVYLNATVLGLTREQVDARFADITAFADIGEFIEQPVKTYSSGMALRLAFAVIAHVDAEVLIIDEALAVGDAVFTQKCMRFLRRFREHGTVLFVSHDPGSIMALCDEAIWLDGGHVRLQGPAKEVADAYAEFCAQAVLGEDKKQRSLRKDRGADRPMEMVLDQDTRISFFDNVVNADGWETGDARIESVALTDPEGEPVSTFSGGERVVLTIHARAQAPLASPIIGFLVKDRLGQSLFGHNTWAVNDGPLPGVEAGDVLQARFAFALPLLPNGEYSMTVAIADGDPAVNVQHHWLHDAVLIAVHSQALRYGLVGIPFDSITTRVLPAAANS